MKIKFCEQCGREYKSLSKGLCKKHYNQLLKFGKCLDNNPRTVKDPNEIRVFKDYAEIDTYDSESNVFKTYIIDTEDVPKLGNHKWRTIVKTRNNKESYYLGTGHTIYFHRLIMGDPPCEVNHINHNTLDNRKENLSTLSTSANHINIGLRPKRSSQIKGVYYCKKENNYVVEFRYNNKRYYSKHFNTIEEATYMRYLYEQHFIPQYSVNNTEEVIKMINKLTSIQKKEIQTYFSNRLKNQV